MKISNILGAGLATVLGLSMPSFAEAQTPEDTGTNMAGNKKS